MQTETFKPLSKFKIVCDLETSGNCPINNGVIAACILIINEDDEVIDKFVRYVCPPNLTRRNWSIDAQGAHGITFEQVQTFMSNEQFCYELLMFLAKYKDENNFPLPFICHASPGGWFENGEWKIIKWFDYNFLMWAFKKAKFENGQEMVWSLFKVINSNNLISTVAMGRTAGYEKNKLKEWGPRLGINMKNHHDAEFDTWVCLEVYKYLKNQDRMI